MSRKDVPWIIIFCLGLLLLIGGCRYQLQVFTPPAASKIAIPTFSNQTFEEGLENVLSRAVIEEFLLHTGLQVVEESQADLILEGQISRYLKESVAGEYRVRIEVTASLRSRKDEETLWREKIEEGAAYSLGGIIQTEDEAIKETCRMIGRDLVNLTIEGWKR